MVPIRGSIPNQIQRADNSICAPELDPESLGNRHTGEIIRGATQLHVPATSTDAPDITDDDPHLLLLLVVTYWPARTWFPELIALEGKPTLIL